MEVIDKKECTSRPRQTAIQSIYVGALLIVAGIVWMLYNLDVIGPRFFNVVFSWPMLIIAVGGFLLFSRNLFAGGLITLSGVVLMMAREFGFKIPVGDILLPCVLIAVGIAFVVPRLR